MSSEGLRARWKLRRTEPGNGIELGASSANAFFTSNRIRQRGNRTTKAPPQNGQQATAKSDRLPLNDQNEIETKEEQPFGLDMPPHSQLLAELVAVDELVESQTQGFDMYFSTWKGELLADFNLLFYGVGSKLALLQILNMNVKPNQSLSQQCREMSKSVLPKNVTRIYLLVHSIDGVALRTVEAQTCLSWLAKVPFISLVASMDHINGPSIWKEEDMHRFEWLSQNLDTCVPYTTEIELTLVKHTKAADVTSSGVKFILQSLTPTDVATLQELARQQLAASNSIPRRRNVKLTKLVPYQSVYEACRRKLLHSTPLAMKNSVKCLQDHGLLKKCRVHSVEHLEIPLPETIIQSEILRVEDKN
ncbi:hypothetical protein CCR75_001748 [Bremia lactucae]|uniref:Origin recognition complex subunit 2 n=1 Tax=Bremia lactucae TaxID=4779 RepID=A0A976FSC2_BRELC|nr:hypothetical protein CCR75_001748 [Bremia lactucae]